MEDEISLTLVSTFSPTFPQMDEKMIRFYSALVVNVDISAFSIPISNEKSSTVRRKVIVFQIRGRKSTFALVDNTLMDDRFFFRTDTNWM